MLYSSGVRRFKDTHPFPEWLALDSGLNANSRATLEPNRASWTGTVTWFYGMACAAETIVFECVLST